MAKGEIAHHEQYLILPHCFQKSSAAKVSEYLYYFSRLEVDECNFPDLLKVFFIGQAGEIARKCVQPPKKPNPK